jgi:uncharacterized OB-fold protein
MPPGQTLLKPSAVPFVLGLVELDGAGIRVLAPIVAGEAQPYVGMPLELDVHPLNGRDEDTTIMAFCFRERALPGTHE